VEERRWTGDHYESGEEVEKMTKKGRENQRRKVPGVEQKQLLT
jgi:hypothetical protein